MKNDEKAIIIGAITLLAYFLQEKKEKKEKKVNVPNLSISPPVFYA